MNFEDYGTCACSSGVYTNIPSRSYYSAPVDPQRFLAHWDCDFCGSQMVWHIEKEDMPRKCTSCGAPRRFR